jgi:hypothetical protein
LKDVEQGSDAHGDPPLRPDPRAAPTSTRFRLPAGFAGNLR